MPGYLVFTDLDGTLLDHDTYSYAPASDALARLRKAGAPLVMVSSKTRPEIEAVRKDIGNQDPFIPENGGAVFIPQSAGLNPPANALKQDPYHVVVLGLHAADVAPLFDRLAGLLPVRALSRMTAADVSALTGLTPDQAESARAREFGEAFVLDDPAVGEPELAEAVASLGLRLTRGGRFYHLLGENDKGRAVRLLSGLYREKWPDLITAAVGDAPNDLPMLAEVDRPFLVARPDGTHHPVDLPGLTRIPRPGPAGFNQAVLSIV